MDDGSEDCDSVEFKYRTGIVFLGEPVTLRLALAYGAIFGGIALVIFRIEGE